MSAAASVKTRALAAAALICCFIGVVAWFACVDFYHRHFFDTGPIVAVDNVVRVVFVVIFSWLIYAPGAAIAALVMSADELAALTPSERAVLGFGIGVGVWHVVMLILGLLGLYDRPVIVGLCLVVVVASSWRFANAAIVGWRALAVGFGTAAGPCNTRTDRYHTDRRRGRLAIAPARAVSRWRRRLLYALLLLLS